MIRVTRAISHKERLLAYLLLPLIAGLIVIQSTVDVAIWSPTAVEDLVMSMPLQDPLWRGPGATLVQPETSGSNISVDSMLALTPANRSPTTSHGVNTSTRTVVKLEIENGQRNTELGLIDPSTPELAFHLRNLSLQPMTSLAPWPNITSLAFYDGRFYSGYRNQMMAFTMMIFVTKQQGHGQLLLPSIAQKDTYGTNRYIPFAALWDVPHWNSHYPTLPRLVNYDPWLHDQYNLEASPPWFLKDNHFQNADGSLLTNKPVRPHAFGKQHHLMAGYMFYAKGRGTHAVKGGHRNPLEILMLKGALRPHPNLQTTIDEKVLEMLGSSASSGAKSSDYMTLHARVEPDMQRHMVCRDKKVLNLTDIFEFIETKWKDPPVSKIFMPINRQYLEKEGLLDGAGPREKVNWIAVENLKSLNRARDFGLWNGRVRVYEFGANSLAGTAYEKKPSTPGALLDFFIGIQAKIFIGTEVSSFSHDLLATRFFRGMMENYKYLPEGIFEWTPGNLQDPPGFNC